jgi:CHAT domain-containing protein
VKQLRVGMDQPAAAFDVDDSRRLYDLTLRGVADTLRGAKEFVFAPTGPMLSMPFEVLLTGPADPNKLAEAPWLMREAPITHVPAPTNFVSLRKVARTSKAPNKWFGFGDFRKPDPAQIQSGFPGPQCGRDRAALASLPLLPGATAELDAVRQIVAARPQDELLGPAFTASQVMNLDLKSYQILHFAAHALLPTDLECLTEAAIVTSPSPGVASKDGWLLTASRLLNLDLDANLVILSACNSGGGDGKSGESLSGLARSFFFARARSLLVTHWEVSDKVAALLVALTINAMKEKPDIGVTGALRQAQLTLLDQAAAGKLPDAIARPFFWAPFAVIGEGGEGSGGDTLASRL